MYISNYFTINTYSCVEKKVAATKEWIVAHRAFVELAASFAFNYSLTGQIVKPVCLFLLGSALPTDAGKHMARLWAAYLVGQAGPQIALHELGHAFAALCLFKNANPKISITPFKGGFTSYVVSYGKTGLGNWLGKEMSKLAIAAAGIGATTTFALLGFALAHQLAKKHPTFSACLNYQSAAHLLADVHYGLWGYVTGSQNLEHDFIYLWRYGNIHPLIPLFLMLALPATELALLSFLAKKEVLETGNHSSANKNHRSHDK